MEENLERTYDISVPTGIPTQKVFGGIILKFILIKYGVMVRPPLWFSGQSSWLQNGDVLFFL
jgi:hypothetical protein